MNTHKLVFFLILVTKFFDKFFPFLVPSGLLLGMFLGDHISGFQFLVPWIFAGVTFIGGMKMDVTSFTKTIAKPKPIIVVMLISRILMPLWALIFGLIVFPSDIHTQTGLLLFALIPVGVNSVLWTMMSRGNVPLSLSVVLLDTLISPIVLPLSILFLTGTSIELDTPGMMVSLLQMIVLPSILGMIVNQFSKGEIPKKWNRELAPFSKIGIVTVIVINGSTVADYFTSIDFRLLLIMGSIAFLAASGYTIAWNVAKLLKLNPEDTKAVVFSGGMRNINTGIVIAVAHFPAAAAIPVVTGVLFQQLVCATFAKLLMNKFDKETIEN